MNRGDGMGQLKVRYTIEHHNKPCSFSSLAELKKQSFSDLIWSRLSEFEIRLKRAAADVWLQHRLGAEHHSIVQILVAQDDRTSEITGCTPKA
jgi:hypothetical protein